MQHLPEIGRRGRVDQRDVPLPSHRFDHPQCGQRIDEAGRAGCRVRFPAAAAGRQPPTPCGAGCTSHHPARATVRPNNFLAAGELPASITVPAPSLPTGIDWSMRPFMAPKAPAGTVAVTTGSSSVPTDARVLRSAAPNSSPMSDGLSGAAIDADDHLVVAGSRHFGCDDGQTAVDRRCESRNATAGWFEVHSCALPWGDRMWTKTRLGGAALQVYCCSAPNLPGRMLVRSELQQFDDSAGSWQPTPRSSPRTPADRERVGSM